MSLLKHFLLVGGLCLMSLAHAGDGVFPYPYEKVELKNGFRAYLIQAGAPGSFTYVTMVRTGSRDEFEPGQSGFAHFFEHMMFRGTEKYPHFDDVIAEMGAASNAFTSNDMTVYYISAAAQYLEQVFDLESDRFQRLKYDEDAFKTEAGAVLGEHQQSKFSPFNYLDEHTRLAAYDKHTYRHTTIGFEDDVRAMPNGYEYSLSFHQRHYRPENCVLVLVGDFDSDAAKKHLKTYYGDWKKGYSAPPIPEEPEQTSQRETLIEYPSRTLPFVTFNYKGPAWSATDPLAVATEVLGKLAFGPNSDLYRKLVLEEQRLQALMDGFDLARDPGLLQVIAVVMEANDVGAIRAELDATVKRFQTELVDQADLDIVKANLKYRFLMGLETSRSTAFALLRFIINTGRLEAVEDYAATLEKVTPELIRQAAQTYLKPERNTIAVMVQKGTDVGATPEGIIELHDPDSPFVSFNIWVKTGSQNDPQGKSGLASLTSSLLDGGSTGNLSYQEIVAQLFPMAAGFQSATDKEMTVFKGTVHRDHLEAYYRLFRDRILDPGFRQEDFERIKNSQLNFVERLRRYSRDEELTKELLMSRVFGGTAYEHPEEGYVQSVHALTLDDVKAFFQSQYTRGNVVIGLAGGYPKGFASKVRRDFDALPEVESAAVAPSTPAAIDGVRLLLVEKETNAAPVSIGFPTELTRAHSDFFPMMVFNSWFGEHRNSFSHLYQVIREERGMNYGDYSYIEAFPLGYTTQRPVVNVARRNQIFEIWLRPLSEKKAGTLHDQTLFGLRAALRELQQVVDHGMKAEDVERTKSFLANFTLSYAETQQRQLDYAIDDAFLGLETGFLDQLPEALAAVNVDQVNNAIKRHLQTDNMHVVIVTQDAAGLKQKILSGEPTMLTYASDPPAHLADEDQAIASFPLNIPADHIDIVKVEDVYESPPE